MIKIEAFHEYPLEEGAMINGVITDDSSILEIFRAPWPQPPKSNTAVNTNDRQILFFCIFPTPFKITISIFLVIYNG